MSWLLLATACSPVQPPEGGGTGRTRAGGQIGQAGDLLVPCRPTRVAIADPTVAPPGLSWSPDAFVAELQRPAGGRLDLVDGAGVPAAFQLEVRDLQYWVGCGEEYRFDLDLLFGSERTAFRAGLDDLVATQPDFLRFYAFAWVEDVLWLRPETFQGDPQDAFLRIDLEIWGDERWTGALSWQREDPQDPETEEVGLLDLGF